MSGSGLDAHPDGWAALPDVQERSRGPPECLGVVGRPSQMVGSPYLMSVSGRESLQDFQEWSEGPHGFLGVVGSPSRKSGSVREALLDVR